MKGGESNMDTATYARVEEYLEVYERIKQVIQSDEVGAAIIEQIGKDTRCAWLMNGRSNGNGNGDEPATEKQLGFLKKLKVELPANLSKREASRLIDEAQAGAA